MSKFDLGLEALAEQNFETTDILSYEYLDTVMQFNDEAAEAVVIADGIESLAGAMENLSAICEVLSQHGNSPALEALVGGNFREGFSIEAAEAAKEGLWARFVKWLKTLWAKVKAFFAKFFSSASSMEMSLRKRAQELQNGDMKEVTVSLPKPDILKGINDDIITKLNSCLNLCQKDLDALEAGTMPAEKSEDLDIIEKTFGEEGKTIEINKEEAIKLLIEIADHLKALSGCKKSLDSVADSLQRASFKVTDADVKAAGNAAKAAAPKGEKKEAQATAEARTAYKGSDDRRQEIMRRHSQFTKFLNKATKKGIAQGSLALSAFKVAKTTK